jgi:hypothetical protein
MNKRFALLLFFPVLGFAAEGDIPIEQAGGAITTQTVSGDATITSAGVLSLATGSVGDNEIDYTTVTLADFTNDAGFFDALADFTGTLTSGQFCRYDGSEIDCDVTFDTDLATFSVPASTTISAFGATLVDDADAATARTTLDVDQAGTDNSTDVTVNGEDFLTLATQQITANAINPDNLASADFGDFTCNGTNCSIDNGTATPLGTYTASENLSAGDLVSFWNDTGTVKVRQSDADDGQGGEAHGYVLAAVTSGNNATVYTQWGTVVTDQSGLTLGAPVYLSATAGQATSTAPSTTGQVLQRVGIALSATTYLFTPYQEVELQ